MILTEIAGAIQCLKPAHGPDSSLHLLVLPFEAFSELVRGAMLDVGEDDA
jgi:hypothetical protein